MALVSNKLNNDGYCSSHLYCMDHWSFQYAAFKLETCSNPAEGDYYACCSISIQWSRGSWLRIMSYPGTGYTRYYIKFSLTCIKMNSSGNKEEEATKYCKLIELMPMGKILLSIRPHYYRCNNYADNWKTL